MSYIRFWEVLNKKTSVAISGHKSPDGDCVGACLALAMALVATGKHVTVLAEEPDEKYADMMRMLNGTTIELSDTTVESVIPEVFIALDCSSPGRLGPAESLLRHAEITISIDHHKSTEPFAQLNLTNPKVSSTCEMVYELLEQGGINVTPTMAAALYGGIVYDTNGFRNQGVSPRTHEIAAKLLGRGINFTKIYDDILNSHSQEAISVFCVALERARWLKNLPVMYTFITQKDMEDANAKPEDLASITLYMLHTRGVELAVFVYEKAEGKSKVNMRSKKVDVCGIAAALGGGGHKLAAGATVSESVSSVLNDVLCLVKKTYSNENE